MFLMKLLFIYSKLEDGWSVTKMDTEKFEFKKYTDVINYRT